MSSLGGKGRPKQDSPILPGSRRKEEATAYPWGRPPPRSQQAVSQTCRRLYDSGNNAMVEPAMEHDERVEHLCRRLAETEQALLDAQTKLQRQLKLAATVHRSLLPRPVRHERIHVDVRYVPVEGVGGDYCQVDFCDRQTCYITICDVTGHGIGSALLATRVSN